MNQHWTKSILLHVGIVVALCLSSLSFCSRDDERTEPQTITVDLMPIGEKTNVKPAPKQEKKPTPIISLLFTKPYG